LVQLRDDRRDQGAELVSLVQHVGLGQVEQVAVQLGDLHGEPSVLVRLAPPMAGQQFPVGLLDMVGVPSAGEHDAHQRGPVVDCAAQRERAVEDLDQPPRAAGGGQMRQNTPSL
jgi:hypothetical protein